MRPSSSRRGWHYVWQQIDFYIFSSLFIEDVWRHWYNLKMKRLPNFSLWWYIWNLSETQCISILCLGLTWLSRDDPNLSKLKSKVEPVVPHDQVVIQLAPVFNFLYFYWIFWKIAFDFLSHCKQRLVRQIDLSWPSWRRPSKENSSSCSGINSIYSKTVEIKLSLDVKELEAKKAGRQTTVKPKSNADNLFLELVPV